MLVEFSRRSATCATPVRASPTIQNARPHYPYRCTGGTNDVMPVSAVAATRPPGKSPAIRDRASKSRSPHSRASSGQGGRFLRAAADAGTSSRSPAGMPAASSADFAAHSRARQRSKEAPARTRDSARTASSRSHKLKTTRTVANGGGGAAAAAAPFSSAGRPGPFTPRGSSVVKTTYGRHNQRNSRWVCRISEEIALHRMQRAVRCFLMHRYLQRTVPVASVPLSMSESLAALESRFLQRLRAALYRQERAAELRTGIAKRVIQAALRRWAQTHPLQHRRLFLLSRVQTVSERCPLRAAELDTALCSIQASLRTRESSYLLEARRVNYRQQTAVRVLERAWQKTPRYAASIRHIHDRQVRDVLCRQEAVERRDILRRRLIFMVCCHQAFFNDPRMWEAGVAIRRIPLNAPHGLLSTEMSYTLSGTAAFPSPLTSATADSVPLCGDGAAEQVRVAASPLQPETPQLSPAANANGSICCSGSPAPPGLSHLEIIRSSLRGGREEEDGGRLDIDAALRLGEYRLLFSPAQWRLLVEVKALPQLRLTLPLRSGGADEKAERRGAHAADPSHLQAMAAESVGHGASSLSYAQSFMSALAFLRQPHHFDADCRCIARHLHDIRCSTAEMQQELRTHGYVSAALAAPFLTFGLHCQGLVRGDADSSSLTNTAGMKMCRPLVAGRVACAATELRRCLVGVAHGCGDATDAVLPVVLEEHRCGFKPVARKSRQRPPLAGVRALALSYPRATPTAGFMRDGFSNPATEALYRAATKPTRRAGAADPTRASPRRGSAAGINLSVEWRRRLAVSADDVGPYWREFFVSAVVNAFVTITGKQGEVPGEANAARGAEISSASPLPPALVRRGLESRLLPGAPSYLLRDFMPSRMRRHAHARAGSPPVDTAGGAVVFAVAQAGASPSSSLSLPTRAVAHPGEWWDAVERLLLQEYACRTELLSSEAAQRRSIDVLQRLAYASADESLVGT
ncbi:hypothetical protein JIQ42_00172 [Leishmania sp. Namibia]|uniref:hypothetical protein n=1 Tax=Leishmania sp. Namibia TaxID=2802991 RepID=UPI001B6DF883|nr:hypothetical protein JIQ42_00172 [Leishmania sp. Namibia]